MDTCMDIIHIVCFFSSLPEEELQQSCPLQANCAKEDTISVQILNEETNDAIGISVTPLCRTLFNCLFANQRAHGDGRRSSVDSARETWIHVQIFEYTLKCLAKLNRNTDCLTIVPFNHCSIHPLIHVHQILFKV